MSILGGVNEGGVNIMGVDINIRRGDVNIRRGDVNIRRVIST